MSAKVPAAPSFVTVVLSVTLKTRELLLPAMVNVFAVASTAETVPRNGIARADLSVGEAAAEAAGEALAEGEAVADFLEAATAACWPLSATAVIQTPAIR